MRLTIYLTHNQLGQLKSNLEPNEKMATKVKEVLIANGLISYDVQYKQVRGDIEIPTKEPILTISKIVCNEFEVRLKDVYSYSRLREVKDARHATRYYIKKFTEMTYKGIGRVTDNADHSTIIHSCNVYQDFLDTDKSFRSRDKVITEQIKTYFDLRDKCKTENSEEYQFMFREFLNSL